MNLRRKNSAVVAACIGAIGVMTGLVAYSPTVYRLFCAATGYGGTTQRAADDFFILVARNLPKPFNDRMN